MHRSKVIIAAFAFALSLASCATTATVGANFSSGVLTDKAGMTLYTFDKDTENSGKSVCNGNCANNWPPLAASVNDKPGGFWSIVTRDDGSLQWAYKGKPAYRWNKDQKPGDMTGDGFGNSWRIVKEDLQASAPRDRERSNAY